MPWPDDYILYSINVEDVRRVAEEEELRELTDEEIQQIEDKLGDHIDWYEAVLVAIHEVIPDIGEESEEEEEEVDDEC